MNRWLPLAAFLALAALLLAGVLMNAGKDTSAIASPLIGKPVPAFSLPVLADEEGRIALDFGIYGAPETFLVDAQGIIRWKHVGPITDEVLRAELEPLFARHGVPGAAR